MSARRSEISCHPSGERGVEPSVGVLVARVVDLLVVPRAAVRRVVEDGNAGRGEVGPRHLEEMATLGMVTGPCGMNHNVELAVKLRAVFSSRLLQNPRRQLRISI